MMKQWVVTGYSSKMDGLLYIVKANTKEEAFKKITEGGSKYIQCEINGETIHAITDRRDISIENIKEDMEMEESPRWWWQAWAMEVKENINLHDAVCW